MRKLNYLTRKTFKFGRLRFYVNRYKLSRKMAVEMGAVIKGWRITLGIKNNWEV